MKKVAWNVHFCVEKKQNVNKKYIDCYTKYYFTLILPFTNKANEAKIMHLYGKRFFFETVTRYQKIESLEA
jgi:hypothetical protein